MNWRTQPALATFEEDEREMGELLANLPDCARQATDLPESFWRRQQIGVRAAIATQPAPLRLAVLGWGTALAVLIIAMLAADLDRGSRSQPQQQQKMQAISDQQLLMKVEYTLQNDVPVALEPAALLAQEMQARRDSEYSEGD